MMAADPIAAAGTAVTSCRVLACLSLLRKRMEAKGALARTSAAAGTAVGGLRQARTRSHEGGECPLSRARWRRKKKGMRGHRRFWWWTASSPASLVRRGGDGNGVLVVGGRWQRFGVKEKRLPCEGEEPFC